jgi:D-lactate dehydrogenase (cytochrome)
MLHSENAAAVRPLPENLVTALAGRFGDAFTQADAVRAHHGEGECFHPHMPPQGVIFPKSSEEVAAAVKAAAGADVPVIPYGAGSSLEGHVLATQGGLTIDLSGMNRILEVNAEDLDCTVEAGVTRNQLNRHLRDTGFSSRSIRVPTRPSAGWRQRGRPAPMRCATARCAPTCSA